MKKLRLMFLCALIMGTIVVPAQKAEDWIDRMFSRQAQQKHASDLKGRADQYAGNVSDNEEDAPEIKEKKAKAKRMFAKLGELSGMREKTSAYIRTTAGHATVVSGLGRDTVKAEFERELSNFKE